MRRSHNLSQTLQRNQSKKEGFRLRIAELTAPQTISDGEANISVTKVTGEKLVTGDEVWILEDKKSAFRYLLGGVRRA